MIPSPLDAGCRAAVLVQGRNRVQVRETFFVRGQVLIQVWSYASGDPGPIAGVAQRAANAGCARLDRVAWSQQASSREKEPLCLGHNDA